MSCCTNTQIKTRLGIDNDASDAILTSIATGVAAMFAGHCGRQLVRPAAAVTEYYHGGHGGDGDTIYLSYFPDVVITSVKEALNHGHASEDALTANEDYVVNDARGRLVCYGAWLHGVDAVQVVYKGGYVAAGSVPGEGEHAMPDAIVEAAILQGCFVFQRRHELGLTSQSSGGGGFSAYTQDKLLPAVRELLAPYRRVLL